jgi:hypothetical protein
MEYPNRFKSFIIWNPWALKNTGYQNHIVITEKLSVALHMMVEERHQFQQQVVHLQQQNPSKRKKHIHLVQKLKCSNSPKEARA